MIFDEQMKRWPEHLESIINCQEPTVLRDCSSDMHSTIQSLKVNMEPFSEAKMKNVINKLKNGKAAGIDSIQPELLTHSDTVILQIDDRSLQHDVGKQRSSPDWQCGIILFYCYISFIHRHLERAIYRIMETGEASH